MAHPTYDARKRQRRDRQAAQWAQLQTLPLEAQATYLFETWPQRVPTWVWTRLSEDLKRAWRMQRLEHGEQQKMGALLTLLQERHQVPLMEVLDAILQVTGPRHVVVSFPDLADLLTEGASAQVHTVAVDLPAQAQDLTAVPSDLFFATLLALEGQGQVLIEQALPSPRHRAEGAPHRYYGLDLADGEWVPLRASQVQAYCTMAADEGRMKALAAQASFGELTDLTARLPRTAATGSTRLH